MESNQLNAEKEQQDCLQVYLRIKPCTEKSTYRLKSSNTLITSTSAYNFTQIFASNSSQQNVFDKIMKKNLENLLAGVSFTLLTYGASGSGKTYTLMGTVQSPGLIPRALEYLFKCLDAATQPLLKPTNGESKKLSSMAQKQELQHEMQYRAVSIQ